jgi:hypothetical protein
MLSFSVYFTEVNLTQLLAIFILPNSCPGLILLRHCANISDNRKMMLANRAPTILLRILLDILNAMNRSSGTTGKRLAGRKRSSTFDFSASLIDVSPVKRVQHVEGNPTTDSLQEIIEMLASDISSEISDESKSMNFVNLTDFESCNVQQAAGVGQQDENRTLPLVLKSLHSTDLSPPLRKVIAKLLPFLTYGQVSQSKELGEFFVHGKKGRKRNMTPIIPSPLDLS